jgi:hypothetical protein
VRSDICLQRIVSVVGSTDGGEAVAEGFAEAELTKTVRKLGREARSVVLLLEAITEAIAMPLPRPFPRPLPLSS